MTPEARACTVSPSQPPHWGGNFDLEIEKAEITGILENGLLQEDWPWREGSCSSTYLRTTA